MNKAFIQLYKNTHKVFVRHASIEVVRGHEDDHLGSTITMASGVQFEVGNGPEVVMKRIAEAEAAAPVPKPRTRKPAAKKTA